MPSFKLNGEVVPFEPGEMILEAAARHGVSVPYYCYHPDLTRPANCRMCLVEMTGAPKLITACSWPVNEKMEIFTDNARVKAAQGNVMEFLLANHPLDCPICDQAGECKLQQYSYLFGKPASAMEEPKVKLEKRKVLGPHVVLDQERCISCTRCVRFTEEVTGTGELAMVNRSAHSTVDLHPDRELANAYSGCVVDMCPVGALTDRQFRFQSRVWYLQPVTSTCTLCSRGCNVNVDFRGERARLPEVKRIRARRNPSVNKSWICDEGRYGYLATRSGERPTHAAGGAAAEGPADELAGLDAAERAAATLLSKHAGEKGWLGVLASGSETNEELAALAAFARAADAEALLVVPHVEDGDEDEILRRKDKSANQAGARLLGYEGDASKVGARRVLLLIDADLRPNGGLQAAGVKVRSRGAATIAFAAHQRPWLPGAAAFLPLANAFERDGTIVSTGNIVQRVRRAIAPQGHARPLQDHLTRIGGQAGLVLPPFHSADEWLAHLCRPEGPFAPMDPATLGDWGVRLPAGKGGSCEVLPAPLELFSSAPLSFGEGEYSSFLPGVTAPPAIHVAAGAPSHLRMHGGAAATGEASAGKPDVPGEGAVAGTSP